MATRSSALLAAATSLLILVPVHAQDTTPPPEEYAPSSEAPAETPADAPVEASAEAPAETPAETPAEPTVPTIAVQEEPAAEPAADNAVQLDELVVTATKRRQTAREIPNTINVITGDKLEIQGARELSDYVDQIPGLQMQELAVASNRKIIIRGIAPTEVGNQTVGTLLGDVPMNDPIGSFTVIDPDTWDLETFEVLKGPQGTLFGASSLAGVIRYVPQAPVLGLWQGKAAAEYVSVKDGGAAPTFSAAINAPVGNTLAFRLAGVQETRPGVIDINTPGRAFEEDADEAKKWAGRLMALWEPTENLSINAWVMAQERKANEQSFVTNREARYERNDAPGASPQKRSFDMGVLDARYKFDWATIVSLTSMQNKALNFNTDVSYILAAPSAEAGSPFGRAKRDVDAKGFMQELRLVSPDEGPWLWQAGAFYSKFDASVFSDIFLTDPATSQFLLLAFAGMEGAITTENGVSIGNARLDPLGAEESALFGELTYEFATVKVTLGGRLYETQTQGTSTVSGVGPFAATGQATTVENLEVADDGFSPKVAVAWQATDDVLAYGSASRGFQYGGINNRAIPSPGSTSPRTYTSSSLWAYEAGLRTDWFERSLRADVTAFYQDWTDAQIEQLIPPADFYIDNVGKVKVKGVEAALRYAPPIDGLTLDATGGWLQARTASPFTTGGGDEIPAGATMPNSPEIQASATINYSLPLGTNWTTATALQLNHLDESFGNVENDAIIEARDMLNFNFTVTGTGFAYQPAIGLVVNNITDERKIASDPEGLGATQDPARSSENFPLGYTRPRTIILRLSASFQ